MLDKIRSSKISIVFVVCISIFTDTFMYGVIIPVLPYALARRVGIDQSELQFWNTTFMASWAGALLLGSIAFGMVAAQGVSKKVAFLAGQLILLASTLLFMLARNIPLLIIARVLQGLSGGAINTLGYTLTFDAVGQDQIGTAIGYVAMSLSLGTFFGPVVGGPLYDAAGYVWIFIPLVILIGIETMLRAALIDPEPQEGKAAASERQRLLGQEADFQNNVRTPARPATRSSVTSPLMRPRRSSMGDPTKIWVKRVESPAGTTAVRSPFLVLLGNRRFVIAMYALFIGNIFVGAVDATLPVFAKNQLSFSSTKIGLLLLCPSAPQFLGPLAGWVVDRIGPKWPTTLGFVAGGVAMVLLRLTEQDSAARLAILIILLLTVGFATALFWGPIVAEVTLAVEDLEKREPGVFGEHGALSLAFGLQNAAFGAGAMVGPIVAGVVLVNAGWGNMGLVLGTLALVTTIPVVLFTGGNLLKKKEGRTTTNENDSGEV